MARHVEGPWYRQGKGTWYATLNGKNVSLRVKGEGNRSEAVRAWHRLMASDPPAAIPATTPVVKDAASEAKHEAGDACPSVRTVADAFLSDAATRLKENTVRIYRTELDRLCRSFGPTPAATLTAKALTLWVQSLPLAAGGRSIAIRSASAAFSWAVDAGLMPSNPAKDVKKPKCRSRSADTVISDADHQKLMAKAAPRFRLVLQIMHATGARPGEVCRITAENFDAEAGVVRLTEHKTDHTGKPRLIFLPPEAVELLKGQVAKYPTGPLLRGNLDLPHTSRNITQAMRKLKKKTGVKGVAYGYRHGFATTALVKGVPDAQVAALLGHGSTAMLHRHYSHLTEQAQTLREALRKVR